jgi:hypothetical protein
MNLPLPTQLRPSTPPPAPPRLLIQARRGRGSFWVATAHLARDLSAVGLGPTADDAVASVLPRVLEHLDRTWSDALPCIEIVGDSAA